MEAVTEHNWTSQIRNLQKVVHQNLFAALATSEATESSSGENRNATIPAQDGNKTDVPYWEVTRLLPRSWPDSVRLCWLNMRAERVGQKLAQMGEQQSEAGERVRTQTLRSLSPLLQMMLELARFIEGDYDSRAKLASVRQEFMERAVRLNDAVKDALNNCVISTDAVISFEVQVNDIYDQELIPLKSSAKEFEQDKDLIVQIHQSQIQTQSASLVNHLQTLQVLQDQLKEAQRKYEEAKDAANSARNGNIVLWIFCWPAGLAMQLTLTNNLSEAVQGLSGTVSAAKQSLQDTQGLASRLEQDLVESRAHLADTQVFLEKLSPIYITVDGLRAFSTTIQTCLAELKTRLQSVQTAIGRMLASATSFEYTQFDKVEISRIILKMLNHSLVDVDLIPMAGQVVAALHGIGPSALRDQVWQQVEILKQSARKQSQCVSDLAGSVSA